MARKTVLRRLAKTAPMATDVAELLHRDDADNVDLNQTGAIVTHIPPANRATRPRALEAIAGNNALDAAIAEDDAAAPSASAKAESI
jgi:recombinational DNA repair protein RecT